MHVLIVEDRKSLAEMLRRALVEKQNSAVVAHDGENGLTCAQSGSFDGIILDLMLPGIEGSEIVRRLRQGGDRTPILVLTAKDTVGDIVTLLDLGVDDYLTKPFAMAELMARLRALVRRGPSGKGVRLEVADLTLDVTSQEITRDGTPIKLTRTEYQLLEVLMRRAGQVVPRDTLIERIWGTETDIEQNTLEAFIKTLRSKVDQPYERKLIHTVRGIGYRLYAGSE